MCVIKGKVDSINVKGAYVCAHVRVGTDVWYPYPIFKQIRLISAHNQVRTPLLGPEYSDSQQPMHINAYPYRGDLAIAVCVKGKQLCHFTLERLYHQLQHTTGA